MHHISNDTPDPIPFDPPRNRDDPGTQKGAQQHAGGMQGPKTRAKLLEQLHGGDAKPARPARSAGAHSHDTLGESRLFEQREQHDEAEKNSEKNRLDREIREHGHNRDNFQVEGGSASLRAERRDHINPTEPDAPTPGGQMPTPPTRVPGVGGS
ncbi:MAG: hypothetical protein LH467_04665 [Gemmatimonadaceae bacterium]|nr:hypothetical protein [Gemmatimonadaceae bacterium]